MKARPIALFLLLAAGCASYGADDLAADAACAAREEACIRECDRAFEINRNSWDYTACTDQCREQRGDACR